MLRFIKNYFKSIQILGQLIKRDIGFENVTMKGQNNSETLGLITKCNEMIISSYNVDLCQEITNLEQM